MTTLRKTILLLLLVSLPALAFGQVADMGVTASDSPDPVAPNGNVTYSVTVTNSGPNGATNAQLSMFNNGSMPFVSQTAPAGWNCGSPTPGTTASVNCTAATMGVGATANFTFVYQAPISSFGINDTTISRNFVVNSAEADPNQNNNVAAVTTSYVTPDADLQIAASDSPDPVAPDGNITYTVTVTNAGPDAATNTNLNVPLNNTLLFQPISAPAGWNCTTPPVNGGSSFSCNAPSFAPGSAVFTIVLKAAQSQFSILDQTITQNFGVGSAVADPNNANNSVNVQTQYATPDADLQITASDSPDPVAPDGNITYTVTVTNAGPDAATNTNLNVPLNNTLLFQSISAPAGWNCTTPPVNGGSSFSCNAPSFAPGSAVFTIVLKAAQSQFGILDQTITQNFAVGSAVADPNNGNNSVNVSTAYEVADADLSITASDAPDPVVPGNNVTFTIGIANGGPDAATSATVTIPLDSRFRYVSLSSLAGFNCTTPAAGASGTITCTNPSSVNGGAGTLTLVVQVDPSLLSGPSGSIQQNFTIGSSTHDPAPLNNSAQTTTAFQTPGVADLSITKTTAATNASPGSTITYTITAHDNGPADATNVVITDALPASLLFQSISAPAGFTCTTPAVGATGTITCNGASLINGASAVFTLQTKVASNASGAIVNSATIASAQSDGAASNNGGSAGAVAVGPAVQDIPTLSEWALLALAALLGAAALLRK
jgi:uncharacterized repeat protein (TIGR01451 family)